MGNNSYVAVEVLPMLGAGISPPIVSRIAHIETKIGNIEGWMEDKNAPWEHTQNHRKGN